MTSNAELSTNHQHLFIFSSSVSRADGSNIPHQRKALVVSCNLQAASMDKPNLDNLPDSRTLTEIFSTFRKLNLANISYQKLYYSLFGQLKIIPVTSAILKAGHHIEIARINKDNEIYYSEKEISYRTDFENIKKFGRANLPGQSLFYGAIKSEDIPHPRIINLLETSEILRSGDLVSETHLTMTVGKWRIIRDFEVMEKVFNKNAISALPGVEKSYKHHVCEATLNHPERVEDVKGILEFFSDEFAKKDVTSDEHYKISVAYTNYVLNNLNLGGITYPSVRADYHGYNVALPISVVENFLQLEVVAMFKLYKRQDKLFLDNLAYATELGDLNSNFKWETLEGLPEDFINEHFLKD
jgi:hypothetical protein